MVQGGNLAGPQRLQVSITCSVVDSSDNPNVLSLPVQWKTAGEFVAWLAKAIESREKAAQPLTFQVRDDTSPNGRFKANARTKKARGSAGYYITGKVMLT